MQKLIFFIIAIVLLAVFFVGRIEKKYISEDEQIVQIKQSAEIKKPIIKIGAILPLSGEFSNAGESFKNVALLAQNDLNKKNLKYRYEIVIDDDSFLSEKATSLFQKQIKQDKVDAVVSFASYSGSAIAPLAEKSKIVYVNFGGSDKKIAHGKYTFMHWTMPEIMVKKIVAHYKRNGYKRIVYIGINDHGPMVLEKAFINEVVSQKMIAKNFWISQDEKDFKTVLKKAEAFNPDVYLIILWDSQTEGFIKQYKQAGIKTPITNIENFSMLKDYTPIEGMYFADGAKVRMDFISRLKKEYPTTVSEFGIGNAYDSIMLIVDAFEKAESKNKAFEELAKMKQYNGVLGTLKQDKIGIFHSNSVLKKVINGNPFIVEE